MEGEIKETSGKIFLVMMLRWKCAEWWEKNRLEVVEIREYRFDYARNLKHSGTDMNTIKMKKEDSSRIW